MARSRRTAYRIAAIGAVGAAVAACGLLIPLEREPKGAANLPDGLPDLDATPDPCGRIPERPEVRGDPSLPRMTFVAFKWGFVKDDKDDPDFCSFASIDVDGVDTQPDAANPADKCDQPEAAACLPRPTNRPAAIQFCDDPNGGDNAWAQFYGLVNSYTTLDASSFVGTDFLTHLIRGGFITSVLELTNYSGEADDEDVSVLFMPGVGIEGSDYSDDGGAWTIGRMGSLPEIWDGSADAAWVIDQRAVEETPAVSVPRNTSRGYVRDYILVVPDMPRLVFPLGPAGSTLYQYSGVFTAKIRPPADGGRAPGSGYRLTQGRWTARVSSPDLLRAAGGLSGFGELSHGQVCEPIFANQAVYAGFRRAICGGADLTGDPDAQAKDDYCNGLSLPAHLMFVEARVSRPPGNPNKIITAPVRGRLQVCPHPGDAGPESGTEFCDDCVWDFPDQCAPPAP